MNTHRSSLLMMVAACAALLLSACDNSQPTPASSPEPAASTATTEADAPQSNPSERKPLFGDVHVHTRYSFDAFLMGTRNSPDDAYRFAKGEAIPHAGGRPMQLRKPLDFLGVSDHAFYLGVMPAIADPDGAMADHRFAETVRGATTPAGSVAAFGAAIGHLTRDNPTPENDDLLNLDVTRDAWARIKEAAERHNDPGNFTALIAYEYTTSGPQFENLHRNVVFRGSEAPDLPFSRLDSMNPEDLWDWMDEQRSAGMDSLAVPHNSNGSDGWMFDDKTYLGDPLTADYADQRMRNEPIVENSQVKGTSDTHPLLSPNDEWADFEIMPVRIASVLASQPNGSYVREAWRNGLELQAREGFNPYHFGVIGSSDTHNGAGSFYEDDYWSKTGITDIEPAQRGSVPLPDPADPKQPYAQGASRYWGASALAAVWAEENTRASIFDAMRRKETFSTSGSRIVVRFFGGYDYEEALFAGTDWVDQAYAQGVPMGGDLAARDDATPSFFLWAARDADAAPLQRLQIIKGWFDGEQSHETVYDVACSDGASIDPETHRCPDNGAAVDLSTCATTQDVGAAELRALWQDPDYDPAQHAFYYLRVIENPVCRWSTWDAVRAGVAPNPAMPATVQKRAWSSPIWITPTG